MILNSSPKAVFEARASFKLLPLYVWLKSAHVEENIWHKGSKPRESQVRVQMSERPWPDVTLLRAPGHVLLTKGYKQTDR